MKHDISVEDGIVVAVISGPIRPEDYAVVAREIMKLPGWHPGMRVLIDYTCLDLKEEMGADAFTYAEALVPLRQAMGRSRIACVNNRSVEYGLGRMFQVFAQEMTDLEIGIFYTFEEAMNWLTSPNRMP
jgi:hypothetical protein